MKAKAIRDDILVDIYDDGETTVDFGNNTKFILLDDSKFGTERDAGVETKHSGIRPRWAKVLSTTDHAEKLGIRVGQKVLLDTMKWSRGVVIGESKVWRIPAEDVLGIDEDGFTTDELEKLESRV